jgi:hypothetical protein
MFQMFGVGGARCPRCEHKNAGAALYCERCGLMLGAPRNEPVMVDNRWIAGPDELAVFFGVRELSGVFVKTLRVPATARAYILQGDKATEVPQGEYEIEGFFTRLNHLLRDQHAEILVTRTAALPVEFEFDDLATAEHLKVGARFTVSLRIENVPAFARHFMTMPGVVGSAQLRELLAPPVRQLAAEFVAAQSLREMARNRDLRPQLDERLQGALKLLLAQYGLAAVQVDTLALRHDKFDANRDRVGSLWLVADERHAQLEHAKHLDDLYTEEEWQRISHEEQEGRQRLRRVELSQVETIERAELTLQNAERAQAIRVREIDLYGRIAESKSRRQAIERGAGEVLAELEHDLAKKGARRAGEADEWASLRELARIRMRTGLEVAQQDALQARQLAQQRFSHQLLQQQIRNKIEQAMGIEDAVRQRAELARLHAGEAEAARRTRELEDEEHAARHASLVLAHAARRREAERVLEWEEEQAQCRKRELLRADSVEAEDTRQKIETLRRTGGQADAIAQHEKLLRTIGADAAHARAQQQVLLEAEERRHALRRDEREGEWQHALRRLEHERAERAAQHAHAAELARIEITRAESLGAMDDTAKLALAAVPNAAALADFMKTRVHATMSADQLAALANLDAARMAQEQVQQERAQRDAQADRERRHQLDLLAMQNDVNKAALATQSQLGASLAAGSRCVHGHTARGEDKFCSACGAALAP